MKEMVVLCDVCDSGKDKKKNFADGKCMFCGKDICGSHSEYFNTEVKYEYYTVKVLFSIGERKNNGKRICSMCIKNRYGVMKKPTSDDYSEDI